MSKYKNFILPASARLKLLRHYKMAPDPIFDPIFFSPFSLLNNKTKTCFDKLIISCIIQYIQQSPMKILLKPIKFQWDQGNLDKNFDKHAVTNNECEETFFDEQKVIFQDTIHSDQEERFIILGKTKNGRILFTVFTARGKKIRIISSRDINKKEIKLYEKIT